MLIKKDSELGPSHPIYSKSFEHFALDNIYELTKFHDHIIYGWIDMFKTIPSHLSQFYHFMNFDAYAILELSHKWDMFFLSKLKENEL